MYVVPRHEPTRNKKLVCLRGYYTAVPRKTATTVSHVPKHLQTHHAYHAILARHGPPPMDTGHEDETVRMGATVNGGARAIARTVLLLAFLLVVIAR